ncbi:hypothetical protein RB653_006064 [Dictyostelium firmibasis]|uniref:Uncharacterized protein n=1 Tax=Dictyostelium firmibasis TaxID=79012 RepID=A0AAN7U8C7_9MYCE
MTMSPPNNSSNKNNSNSNNSSNSIDNNTDSNDNSDGGGSSGNTTNNSNNNNINLRNSSNGVISNNINNIPGTEFICPYCNSVYSSKNLVNNENTGLNKCPHLLLSCSTLSHQGETYRSASDLTGNLLGNKIPLVICKRFIKFIRDTKTGTPNGFYTIHQSKARVTNSFQGITSFSLRYTIKGDETSGDANKKITSTIETNYFLTLDPIQDSTLFEAFVLKNYIDSIPSLSTKLTSKIDCLNSDNNINNNNRNKEDTAFIGFSRQQIKTFLEFDDQDANFLSQDYFYSSCNNNVNDDFVGNSKNILNYRWLVITGLPNQLPAFVMLSPQLMNRDDLHFQVSINNYEKNEIDVNVYGIYPLPNIAIQS